MSISISNYIESVLNPNGRFKTLDGIYAVTDREGLPEMMLTEQTIDFETVYNGEKYILKCFFTEDENLQTRLREISTYTKHIDCAYLTPYVYYEDEMLVFDNADKPHLINIILQKKPNGKRLDKFMDEFAEKKDSAAMMETLKGLSNLSEWLVQNDFAHQNLCSRNIMISPALNPVLINYAKAERKETRGDLLTLASLAVAIYISACYPELYYHVIREKTLTRNGLARFISQIASIMSDEDAVELQEVLKIVSDSSKVSNRDICSAIKKLSSTSPRTYKTLSEIVGHLKKDFGHASTEGKLAKYVFIGEMSDMVMRAFDGKFWHYIDKMGEPVISGDFIAAGDFSEGRAVVETKDGFGLIDLDGNHVIEPKCGDIDWECQYNVAIVTIDGMSGLYTREGEPVTGLIYDQILAPGEGLYPARKGKFFGYIRRDGSVAIDFIYDDAFGFKDGFTRVKLGVREFLIDTEGNRIDEIKIRKKELPN